MSERFPRTSDLLNQVVSHYRRKLRLLKSLKYNRNVMLTGNYWQEVGYQYRDWYNSIFTRPLLSLSDNISSGTRKIWEWYTQPFQQYEEDPLRAWVYGAGYVLGGVIGGMIGGSTGVKLGTAIGPRITLVGYDEIKEFETIKGSLIDQYDPVSYIPSLRNNFSLTKLKSVKLDLSGVFGNYNVSIPRASYKLPHQTEVYKFIKNIERGGSTRDIKVMVNRFLDAFEDHEPELDTSYNVDDYPEMQALQGKKVRGFRVG